MIAPSLVIVFTATSPLKTCSAPEIRIHTPPLGPPCETTASPARTSTRGRCIDKRSMSDTIANVYSGRMHVVEEPGHPVYAMFMFFSHADGQRPLEGHRRPGYLTHVPGKVRRATALVLEGETTLWPALLAGVIVAVASYCVGSSRGDLEVDVALASMATFLFGVLIAFTIARTTDRLAVVQNLVSRGNASLLSIHQLVSVFPEQDAARRPPAHRPSADASDRLPAPGQPPRDAVASRADRRP